MRNSMKPLASAIAVVLAAGAIGDGAAARQPVRHRPVPVNAPDMAPSVGPVTMQVATGRGKLVTLARPMTDIFVADPTVADVQVRSPTQLYIFGKKGGETTISATTHGGGVVYQATVRVGDNFDSIGQMLALAMPEAHIVATPMNGLVLLTGTVANPNDAAEAERLTQAFVGGSAKVLSRLKSATPLQVNLQVRIAEVSRSFVKNIGTNLQTFDGTGGFRGGVARGRSQGSQYTVNGPVFTGGASPSAGTSIVQQLANATSIGLAGRLLGLDLLASLDLGETDGQVTTLANPNLTALSGETATFLAGGEIPIPVSQGLGAVSVEYKQYGVSLAYTPTVLSDGRISLRVRPEVSELSSAGAVTISGTTIPALTTRRAETTVELGSGQSFMIAGLLSNNHNNTIEKTPGAGDLPVLGALFRSNAFQRNETELVVVVTPYLVKPVNANDIVLPTDGYKAPTDLGRVLLGQISGGTTGGDRPKPTMAPAPGASAQPTIGAAALAPMAPAAPDRVPAPAAAATADRPKPLKHDRSAPVVAPGFSSN